MHAWYLLAGLLTNVTRFDKMGLYMHGSIPRSHFSPPLDAYGNRNRLHGSTHVYYGIKAFTKDSLTSLIVRTEI